MPARKTSERVDFVSAVKRRSALRKQRSAALNRRGASRRSGLARTYSPIFDSRRRYGGRVSGAWSGYVVPAAKKVGTGIKRTGGAVKSAGVWTMKKGYRGVAYTSPKIYRGGKYVYEYISPKVAGVYRAASPYVTGAARATGNAAHQYIISPTYEWLAGHVRRTKTGISSRARKIHEYMMSP